MPRRGAVQLAVAKELEQRGPAVRESALAATALKLARLLDSYGEPRDMATVSRELRAVLAALPAPVERKDSKVDDLRARREARRTQPAGRPTAEDPVGT